MPLEETSQHCGFILSASYAIRAILLDDSDHYRLTQSQNLLRIYHHGALDAEEEEEEEEEEEVKRRTNYIPIVSYPVLIRLIPLTFV